MIMAALFPLDAPVPADQLRPTAEENQDYVRRLLWKKQPAYAAFVEWSVRRLVLTECPPKP